MGLIIFTEPERQWLFSEMMTLYQNGYYRNQDPVLLPEILNVLQSREVTFTEQQARYIQWFLNDRRDVLTRLTNPRLQHILQGQNTQGFGTGDNRGPNSKTVQGVGGSAGSYHFFHSGKQWYLCLAIIHKLREVGTGS
jgi:hypothetical protein